MSDAEAAEMVVQIRLFAVLRERAGADTLELSLRRGATVEEALARLSEGPPLGELLGQMAVVMAVNRDYAAASTVLRAGDELALIPPVSGGEPEGEGDGRVHVLLSGQPLEPARASRAVADDRAGAIVLFQGLTREVPLLSYEAYAEMAREQLERIAGEALREFALCAAAIEHRTGDVATGEPSVLVAASAPHREEAFAGARAMIDRVKAEVPIWKREHERSGAARWVAGTGGGA
jgi:molybdopterin synthase catalytic subunit